MKRFLFSLVAASNGLWMEAAVAQAPAVIPKAAPRPILIEAVIAEVKPMGSRHDSGKPSGCFDASCALAVLNGTNAASLNPRVFLASTNTPNSQLSGFGYVIRPDDDLQSIAKAHREDSQLRILQRPRIQTSLGVPASLFVGESRPYSAGSQSAGCTTSAVCQVRVGITLEVNPLTISNKLIAMDMHLLIDRVAGTVHITNVGDVPITSSTEGHARIEVPDHQTVLVGGLSGLNTQAPVTVLQFPKELPGVSSLRPSGRSKRSEVVVLLRPTLLTGEGAAVSSAAPGKMAGSNSQLAH